MVEATWGGAATILIAGAFFLFTFTKYHNGTGLRPWTELGSNAHVIVVNPTEDTLVVHAEAPEVDNATRYLGLVPPRDSSTFRLPYIDTRVTLLLNSDTVYINPSKPTTYRVTP